jgi:hypothetical protein
VNGNNVAKTNLVSVDISLDWSFLFLPAVESIE